MMTRTFTFTSVPDGNSGMTVNVGFTGQGAEHARFAIGSEWHFFSQTDGMTRGADVTVGPKTATFKIAPVVNRARGAVIEDGEPRLVVDIPVEADSDTVTFHVESGDAASKVARIQIGDRTLEGGADYTVAMR